MRLEDMPRPWLLAAVTGVPMEALLRRAEQEQAEPLEAAIQGPPHHDEALSGSDRGPVRHCRSNVVKLPSWQ